MASGERHQRLKEVFLASVELEAGERDAYLQRACADDPELLEEVRELISLEGEMTVDVLDTPAAVGLGLVAEAPGGAAFGAGEDELPFPDWDRYFLEKRLASGGMGEVYRAFDPRLKRHVAIKFIRAQTTSQIDRFLREAEAQARVDHENVLEVYETGEVNGRLYIAMRLVDGPTLADTRDATTLDEKVRIVQQVAEAVHAAHREGLVHRDIKPGNIMVERDAEGRLRPFVMDFGIAASMEGPELTATGEMVGTPWYMAPERVTGGPARLDRRTDVYSLGMTMYEYFSGERPFLADNPLEMLVQLQEQDPRPLRQVAPTLPVDLATIVMKCLERDPQQRYPSARALAEDLQRYLDGVPILARPTSFALRLLRKARRNRTVVAVTAVALAILGLLAFENFQGRKEARLREQLAREFGRRVTEIEFVMRMAQIAPRHDVRREREQARDLMAGISGRLEETGLLGEGSGHYALGRGYLTLGEYARAREHLERAWARGYQGPGVASVLGRVLAEQTVEQLIDLESIEDTSVHDARLEIIDRTFRQPAVRYLRAGRGAREEAPEYVEALLAFLEGRSEDALERARAGYYRLSWLHEARRLEGDIYFLDGCERWREGAAEEAMSRWRRAGASYRRATEMARSDPSGYVRLCGLGWSLMELDQIISAGEADAHFWDGIQACDAALFTDPTRADTYRLRSRLYLGLAELSLERGGDPTQSLSEAVSNADRAVGLRPDDARSHLALAEARIAQARYAQTLGHDVEHLLRVAREAHTRAAALDPVLAGVFQGLGEVGGE